MDEVIFQNKPNLYAFCLFVFLCGFKKINQMRFSKGYTFKQNYTFSLFFFFLKKRFSMVFTEEMKIPPI